MNISVIIIAIYSVALIYLATRLYRPANRKRKITGRGGDFES